jgi:hypothetical protein
MMTDIKTFSNIVISVGAFAYIAIPIALLLS